MFLAHQISILEWFLKDHASMNSEVMAAENSALPSQALHFTFLLHFKIYENGKQIIKFYRFHYIFDQINAALGMKTSLKTL